MISEKLFSEVMGEYPLSISIDDNEIIYEKDIGWTRTINIYELAHKCKEWALSNGWSLNSNLKYCWGMLIECADEHCDIEGLGKYTEKSDTEPEAIFKVCEWIREQNDRR